MALELTVELPSGATGNYLRLGSHDWNRNVRRCHVPLYLYMNASKAASAPHMPLATVAQLHLVDAKFDEWVSNAVLAGEGVTLLGQLYEALQAEPTLLQWVIPGLAPLDLAEAEDV